VGRATANTKTILRENFTGFGMKIAHPRQNPDSGVRRKGDRVRLNRVYGPVVKVSAFQ
jgi:hypothetical protein